MRQPTTREINAHLASMSGYCMVYADGWQMRISRARTRNGTKEGRVVNGSGPKWQVFSSDWKKIPVDATVELS